MKIELKYVEHHPHLSRKSDSYCASLWIDGKPACDVENDGMGEPDTFSDWRVRAKVDAYAATLAPVPVEVQGKTRLAPQTAHSLLAGLKRRHEARAKLTRLMATRIVWTSADNQVHVTHELAEARKDALEAMPTGKLAALLPGGCVAQILNRLPLEDALNLYLAACPTTKPCVPCQFA